MTAREPQTVEIHRAAFGTLSNGSDVRMLCTPAGRTLSSEGAATIEAFFYAAWRAVGGRRGPYFALHPLTEDEDLWGLFQTRALGRGAAGEVLVVWVALLEAGQLDQFHWKTHLLLESAFPDIGILPAPRTRLAPHEAVLSAADPPELRPYAEAFDQLAHFVTPNAGTGAFTPTRLTVQRPRDPDLAPLSPEGGLFGLWERLGDWRQGVTYCTWAGLEAHGFPRADQRFGLVLEDGGEAAGPDRAEDGRQRCEVGAATTIPELVVPPRRWVSVRAIRAHVAPLAAVVAQREQPAVTTEEVDDLVTALHHDIDQSAPPEQQITALGERLALHLSTPGVPEAAPGVLREVVQASRNTAQAARAIDLFAAEILPRLAGGQTTAHPEGAVAEIALETGLLPRLGAATLERLGPLLWGDDAQAQALERFLRAADPAAHDWSGLLAALASAPGESAARLRDRVLALAWANRANHVLAEETLVQRLVREGPAAALSLLAMEGPPAAVRRGLFAAVAGRLSTPRRTDPRTYFAGRAAQLRLRAIGEAIDSAARAR